MSQLGFDFGVPPRRLSKVTPARLSTFEDCPRRYRMAYLDRPTPQRAGPWAHATLGAVVHNAMRALFELVSRRRTPRRAAALVDEHWKDAGFADTRQAARYRARARQWVAEYVEQGQADLEPVGVERWVSAPVESSPDAAKALSLIVEGRADRIDLREGELVIVDYKTGRVAPHPDTAGSSQALALYLVAAARTLRTAGHRVELHHLPSGVVSATEHTDESLRGHLERAQETADALQAATDTLDAAGDARASFPTRVGRRCAWCEFRPSCPEGQRVAPAARPWDLLAP